ncbi:MAG: ribonuclease P protein component [Georgenia sp.]
MLPPRHRMRLSDQFSDTVRRGSRSGARRLVVHVRLPEHSPETDQDTTDVLVGFVVPKSVGSAVRRNQVKRRLRALMCERVSTLQAGSRVVVRALPPAGDAGYDDLAHDLDGALAGAVRRAGARGALSGGPRG